MESPDARLSIKVPPPVHQLLRLVAAYTHEYQWQILARLLRAELARLQGDARGASPSGGAGVPAPVPPTP